MKPYPTHNPPHVPTWRFPERLVAQGTKLLTQQCWYWGCDVRRPEGNLLLAQGFARTRPPEGVTGSSLYTFHPDSATQIVLWSFGIFVGQEGAGGLFLNRFRHAPLLLDAPALPPTIWEIEGLPPLRHPAADDRARLALLLDRTIAWTIAYERGIFDTAGRAYREACLAAWTRRWLGLPVDALIPGWQVFAAAVAQSCAA